MSVRPSITLTREGRYYLFVLAFIVGGAVLREVNLLVVLAALMAGPMLFSWRAVVMTMRRLSVRRRVPERAGAGEPIVVTLTVENQRRSLPSWALTVTDEIQDLTRAEDDASANGGGADPTTAQTFFAHVAAGEEQVGSYRLTLTRRGRYRLGPLRLSTGFPFDFVRGTLESAAPAEVLVCPRIGRLSKAWRRQIESSRPGQQRTQRRRGLAEGDYYGLREWRPGDSRRWIHWRTSAKLGTASVLQFEELRHRDLALVVDLWSPNESRSGQTETGHVGASPANGASWNAEQAGYVEFAASLAATAVVELCRRGNSELAVAVGGREVGCWAGTATRVFAQEVLDHLAEARAASPGTAPRSGLAAAFAALRPKLRRGARVVVISTRAEDAALLAMNAEASAGEAEFHEGFAGVAEWLDVRTPAVREMLEFDEPREGR